MGPGHPQLHEVPYSSHASSTSIPSANAQTSASATLSTHGIADPRSRSDAAVAGCFSEMRDDTQCGRPDQLARFGGDVLPINQGRPAPGDLTVVANTVQTYYLTATTPNGTFSLQRNPDGTTTHECQPRGSGICPANGAWR